MALAEVQRLLSERCSLGAEVSALSHPTPSVPSWWSPYRAGRACAYLLRAFLGRLAELTHMGLDHSLSSMKSTRGWVAPGSIFEHEREGVLPDLVCFGKALGGGLPLSACLGSREVMDAWPESGGEALHTSTFLGTSRCPVRPHWPSSTVLEEEKLAARSPRSGRSHRRPLK